MAEDAVQVARAKLYQLSAKREAMLHRRMPIEQDLTEINAEIAVARDEFNAARADAAQIRAEQLPAHEG